MGYQNGERQPDLLDELEFAEHPTLFNIQTLGELALQNTETIGE